MEPELSVRHRPVQARGRERFELILRTGRDQLARVGVDGFTFDGLADAAGIPIGSIYQFFPNKHALICELSAQDTDAIVAALGRAAEQFPSDDWQTDVDRLIDHLADLWRSEPGRRHVWLAMQSTALTRSLAAEQTTRIAEQIVPLVEQYREALALAAGHIQAGRAEALLQLFADARSARQRFLDQLEK